MKAETQTIKATRATAKLLRQIAALTQERQYAVLERLVQQEHQRLQARTTQASA